MPHKEPPVSCPYFDQAIIEIEAARKINTDLRDWGDEWREKYYELDKEYEHLKDEKADEISNLKDTISDLKHELKDKEIQIQSLEADVEGLIEQLQS